MLIDPHAVELACSLDRADFTDDQNADLFDMMKILHESGCAVDVVTVTDVMPDISPLRLTDLMRETPSSAGSEDWIRIIREKRQRRDFVRGMDAVVRGALQGDEFIAGAKKVIDEIVNLGSSDIRPAGEYVDDALDSMGKPDGRGINTGFIWLDNYLHGLKPGQLIVIAGCTRMGKTSFAMNIALHVAQKERVAVFSLEMTRKELIQRAIVSIANVNEDEMNQHPDAGKELSIAAERVKGMNLYIDDKAGVTTDYIKAQCHRIKPAMVVIDYLGLIRTNAKKNGTREQEISEVTRLVKVMAKDLSCPVLLLSQLNRGVDLRKDKRPVLSDLRESGSIEQDADIVLLLHRPYEFDSEADPKAAIVSVAKHRNGQSGDIDMQWDGAHFRYSDREVKGEKSPWGK